MAVPRLTLSVSSHSRESTRHRIDTSDPKQRWRYECPECDSENWRAHNGTFGCRRCGATTTALVDTKTGELVDRDQFEFVGEEANHKGVRAYPPGLNETK